MHSERLSHFRFSLARLSFNHVASTCQVWQSVRDAAAEGEDAIEQYLQENPGGIGVRR